MNEEEKKIPTIDLEVPKTLWDAITQNGAISKNALDFINLKASEKGTHRDYIITAMFPFVAHSVGSKCRVNSLNHSDPIIFYSALVGNPSSNKSNALACVQKPTLRRNKDVMDRSRLAIEEYEKLNANGSKPSGKKPLYHQLVIQDSTPEALINALVYNECGILGVYDELKAFFNNKNRYSDNSSLQQHLITVYDGKQPLIINRVEQTKNLYSDNPYLSLIGTIQPLTLINSFKQDSLTDGFIGRWLFSYPQTIEEIESNPQNAVSLDNWWNDLIINNLDKNFSYIHNAFELDNEAKEILSSFEEYKKEYGKQILNFGGDLDLFSVAASSYVFKCGYFVPRLAAIIHILGNEPNSQYITKDEVKTAVNVVLYYQDVFLNKILPLFFEVQPKKKTLTRREIVEAIYLINPDAKLEDVAKALNMDKGNVSKCKNKKKYN